MEKGYSIIQAAELLGLKPRTVREWVYTGKVPARKLGNTKRWLIMESEIKRLRHEDAVTEHTK